MIVLRSFLQICFAFFVMLLGVTSIVGVLGGAFWALLDQPTREVAALVGVGLVAGVMVLVMQPTVERWSNEA